MLLATSPGSPTPSSVPSVIREVALDHVSVFCDRDDIIPADRQRMEIDPVSAVVPSVHVRLPFELERIYCPDLAVCAPCDVPCTAELSREEPAAVTAEPL